ncbi:MAG: periplasmic heavy metal sensor [Caulobacteraceae bacterium]
MIDDRRLKLLLGISLALNIFLVGTGLGVGVMGVNMIRERMQARAPAVWRATQALPMEDRQLLRRMLRERSIAAAPHVRDARDARREAARLIALPTYDAAAVSAALARARTSEMQARSEIDTAIVSVLPSLDPARRAALAGALVNARLGGRGEGGGRGRGRGPPDAPPPSPPPGEPPPR